MIAILKIVLLVLIFTQVFLTILSLIYSRQLKSRFSLMLSSGMSNARMLEIYSRVFNPLNIRVNAVIKAVSQAKDDLVMINNKHVHSRDLFTTCYTLWQIGLAKSEFQFLQYFHRWQASAFLVQTILTILAFISMQLELLLVPAILIAFILIGSSFYYQQKFDLLKRAYLIEAHDLLDLDKLELLRARSLGDNLGARVFTYPSVPIIWVLRFISPF
jgi:hypothetical protein